jgi:hypothetical protein
VAAVILAFRRPLSRGTAQVANRRALERLSRARPLSVPEAAFATFFLYLDPKEPVEAISRLTGVTVGELRGLWRGPRGLRQAALRYALDEALR